MKKIYVIALAFVLKALQPVGALAILFLVMATVGPPWDDSTKSVPIYIFVAIGLLIGYILWRVPREKYIALLPRIFGWLPVILGALSYGFWYWYAASYPQEIGGDFFHAAADVLPVLLLATVVDVRRTKDLDSKQLVPPIAVVFLGELAALNALAFTDEGMAANFAAVSASLVTSTFALVIAVMANLPAPGREESEDE